MSAAKLRYLVPIMVVAFPYLDFEELPASYYEGQAIWEVLLLRKSDGPFCYFIAECTCKKQQNSRLYKRWSCSICFSYQGAEV